MIMDAKVYSREQNDALGRLYWLLYQLKVGSGSGIQKMYTVHVMRVTIRDARENARKIRG